MNNRVNISLEGKLAIVTGGTRGIGKAIAERLLVSGAKVIITGRSFIDDTDLHNEFKTDKISYCQCDFDNEVSFELFLNFIQSLDRVDILVNNAGINKLDLITDINMGDYDVMTKVNLKAPLFVLKAVSNLMKVHGEGRIINITSIWSSVSRPERGLYSLTKWGVAGFTKTASIELAKHNILVNAVGPGFTLTELTRKTNTIDELKALEERIPLKRLANPEEIANLVLFLASGFNTYITGQNIIIDGGYTNI
ncbi:SDR family NAD(P)-dependent oxidoreductase [Joostella sp. CR20]|uniref:SDR family NAD(P)-dependent oxidoreductase n=1 Tax=Joostella sp. CR20 TaxID=2804312 RepID=UPI00313D4E57